MLKFFDQGYFARKQEIFLAVFSGLCILCGVLEVVYAPIINASTQNILEAIVIFLLLNELHIFLTPLMLLSTHGGRQFMKDAAIELGFYKKTILFISISIVGIFVLMNSIRGIQLTIALGLVLVWSQYHGARQSWGMSSIYRRISNEDNVKWDQWFFAPIGFLHVLFYFILIFKNKADPVLMQYFFYASLTVVIFYFFTPILRRENFWSWARFYDLRLLVYPLAIKGSFLVLAIHGIEYLFITQKFFRSEKKNGKVFKIVFWVCMVAFLLMVSFRTLSLDLTRSPVREWIGIPWLASLLVAISVGFKVFHFWADGFLFTRKHASSRKWILSQMGIVKSRPKINSDA